MVELKEKAPQLKWSLEAWRHLQSSKFAQKDSEGAKLFQCHNWNTRTDLSPVLLDMALIEHMSDLQKKQDSFGGVI